MKAFEVDRYGPPEVLQMREVEKPVPKDDEVLVEIHAASVNKADYIMMSGKPAAVRIMGVGFLRPKCRIPGADVAGRIESVGKDVKNFRPGDEIFGNLPIHSRGGYAEFACAPCDTFALKPISITCEQAATIPVPALTALQALRDIGRIKPGQKVLINGASGGVGTFAVQIAKAFGAEVTAVCSTGNLEMARSMGADHIIDYTKEDFTRNGQSYDLIVAVNGYHPISHYKRALAPNGICVVAGGKGRQLMAAMFLGPLTSKIGNKKVRLVSMEAKAEDLAFVGNLLETGKVVPFIEKRFAFDQLPDAMRHIGQGHARGKVTIVIANDGK